MPITPTNISKTSITMSNASKHTGSPTNVAKVSSTMSATSKNSVATLQEIGHGIGWRYNRPDIDYNDMYYADSTFSVLYNSIGIAVSHSNLSKS